MLQQSVYNKSRHSGMDCVQVALLPDGTVGICDSKDETKPPHIYTRDEWDAFIKGVKEGEFDYPDATEKNPAMA